MEEEEPAPGKRIKLEHGSGTSSKLAMILEREIETEVKSLRTDLERIEERIFQTRSSLFKVRQGVVSEYYIQNNKGGVLQKPPHLAVRRTFMGKEVHKSSDYQSQDSCSGSEESSSEAQDEITIKSEPPEEEDEEDEVEIEEEKKAPAKAPRYIPPKQGDSDLKLFTFRDGCQKRKIRVVVGNVSKWVAPEGKDSATHKWTVYVKCIEPDVDFISLVSKIKFFLHPSYQPHDVVQLERPPFKLSRRGWGEFPLRVQFHFSNPVNKPIDLVHQLKLDSTHSGMQTFGCETVADLSLVLGDGVQEETKNGPKEIQSPLGSPPTYTFEKKLLTFSSSFNDTSQIPVDKSLLDNFFKELNPDGEDEEVEVDVVQDVEEVMVKTEKEEEVVEEFFVEGEVEIEATEEVEVKTEPVWEVEENLEVEVVTEEEPPPVKPPPKVFLIKEKSVLVPVNKNRVSLLAKNFEKPPVPLDPRRVVIQKILPGVSLLKKPQPQASPNPLDSLLRNCPKDNFESALCWVCKRFPFVRSAKGGLFNLDVILSWPRSKQRIQEKKWLRKVLEILGKLFPGDKSWGLEDTLKFVRGRGFSPIFLLSSEDDSNRTVEVKVNFKYSLFPNLEEFPRGNVEEEIDVCGNTLKPSVLPPEPIPKSAMKVPIEADVQEVAVYIEELCSRLRIQFGGEEIYPGVFYPSSMRLLVSALGSFVEDLLRRSFEASWTRHLERTPVDLREVDVQTGILSRQEFDFLTNEGLGEIPRVRVLGGPMGYQQELREAERARRANQTKGQNT